MSEPTSSRVWLSLSRWMTEASQSPRLIVAALVLTGLATSMALAKQATEPVRAELEQVAGRNYPAGVFRAPHPTILAPGHVSAADGSMVGLHGAADLPEP